MDLLPTSEQEQILDAAKAFLEGEVPLSRLRPEKGEIGNSDHLLWPQLGALGFWGLSLDERSGGAGLSVCEEYLLYREFGRHLLSLGALGITLGARIAESAGISDAIASLLSGEARVALANPRGPTTVDRVSSGSWHLLEGKDADWVVAWSATGSALFRADQFRIVEDVVAMDSHMTLLRAELPPTQPAAFVPASDDDNSLRALLLISAYAVGIAEATRDEAVEYAKVREQFGQPIGKFQAVKHRCAEMAIRAEVAYCQATYSALALQNALEDQGLQVIAAKVLATDTALRNSADNIQVHGAFGFTAEANAHLYLKRAHTLDFLGGSLREQKAMLLRQPTRSDYGVG
jgi:alkylation response protein AidB-like acyl-CoA dehydrogenase